MHHSVLALSGSPLHINMAMMITVECVAGSLYRSPEDRAFWFPIPTVAKVLYIFVEEGFPLQVPAYNTAFLRLFLLRLGYYLS